MAKQVCAICGAEINLIQQQQLADKNYICRKVCGKKLLKGFDFVSATLGQVQDALKQVEDGEKIYQQLFVPRLKGTVGQKPSKPCRNKELLVAEDIGLIARVETRYKILIFGKTYHPVIYRIADLFEWELETEQKLKDGKVDKKLYAHLYFWDTPGVSDFRVYISGNEKAFKSLNKYFGELFGIQKTLGNIKNTWGSQIAAIKSSVSAVKAAATGSSDAQDKAVDAMAAINRAQYGDRTEWIAKANAALSSIQTA